MSIPAASQTGLVGALRSLRGVLARTAFPLEIPSAARAGDVLADSLHQLDDYVLPRITNLDAPLVAVVGGSTGSGKSTLVNSMLEENVARASAIRPTTRRPLLIHAPGDAHWFDDARILPGLTRVVRGPEEGEEGTEETESEAPEQATGGPSEGPSPQRPRPEEPAASADGEGIPASGEEPPGPGSAAAPGEGAPGDSPASGEGDPDEDAPADGQDPHVEIELTERSSLPAGLALLDSPDVDSVVEGNRHLAAQLMAAADLWLFVTSASRYADAIPWSMLGEAADRDVVVAIVLNRVPPGVGAQVRPDLARRLDEHGLGYAPLFVISERLDDDDRIPAADVAPISGWLAGLAHDASARASVARQTLLGAMGGLIANGREILAAIDDQRETVRAMRADVAQADGVACGSVVASLADGRVLHSEVLERWSEAAGSGRMRSLEGGVAGLRGRISAWFRRGRESESAVAGVADGIEASLRTILVAEAQGAVRSVDDAWRSREGAGEVRDRALAAVRDPGERARSAEAAIRQWRRSLAGLVGTTGKDKRATARLAAAGEDAVGAALMIVVFSSTAGLSEGRPAAAGSAAGGAERLLEAIFGRDAVRSAARRARESLLESAAAFFAEELAPFRKACEEVAIGTEFRNEVNRAFSRIERLHAREERR